MRTLSRRAGLADLLPPPTTGAIVVAVLSGALFAAVALTMQDGPMFRPRVQTPVELRQTLQEKQARTMELLQAIDAKATRREDRSAVPVRIVTAERPRVNTRRATPDRIAVAGIWSAEREAWRRSWRKWADQRLAQQ